ncbi:hypothetical protein CROQUDRAFT_101615 [Cronartium quercuum f. sp. fusiforme G11]|uniref:Uncharacterized protein n=1 Tax=Cronartium quercuum f. sp. fusiforme G11 TaxID=708437 RepID=A0A9P6T584_9BASI|nr:hypothetical protein CROQUDRAFT_101615 [Cronartium quercuum f. sp. fusiforme G11]
MHEVRALNLVLNLFCISRSFLANGTLVNIGGSAAMAFKKNEPVVEDISGLQSI